ncbi:tripartite tricarboxylate transporter substrate-binding protein [Falsiroseomonas sp. HW251]|uniref:tripartite tricarboxylate transporter substrate-binding protein n=1 Tax=Falsiroseomonas sp. HW251 TaxID=3390998 RepID=UPI003D31F75C
MTSRRLLLAAALALPAPRLAAQGGFPNRPLRLLVPFAPGGNSDTLARLIQPRMAAVLGQSVVVENRPGAGGALAAGQVASSPADGHTLLFESASFVVAQFINRSVPFDYGSDFAAVGTVAEVPYILAAARGVNAADLRGYLAAARARDGLSYGSPGVGSVGHLAGVLLAHRAGVKLEHVPYRGGAEAARDVAAGTLDSAIITAGSIKPVVESGRAVAIAVTATRRGGIEGVPTIAESGFPGFDQTSWNAVFCRAGTPEPARRALEAAVDAATREPDVQSRFAVMGAEPTRAEADALAARVVRERALIQELVRETGISLG